MNTIKTEDKIEIKPGYKKTPIGVIPEEWEVKRIKSIADVIGGGTPSTTEVKYWNGNINWFTPSEIKGKFVSKSERKITKAGLKNSSAKELPIGTILLTTRATIGEASLSTEISTTNQGFQSLVCKKGTNNVFLYELIKFNKNELYRRANGSTFLEISGKEIKQIPLAIPPLPEQKAIADCLSTWDKGIEKLSALIAFKKEQKKGLMQGVFSGKLKVENGELVKVEDKENWLKGWKEVKLGEIGETFNGLTGKTKEDFGKGKPYVSYLNVFNNNSITEETNFDYVEVKEGENQAQLKYGDLVFTTSSETPNEVGMSSVILFHPKKELFLNSFCFGLRLENFEKLNPGFAVYLFRDDQFRKEMYKLAQGSTRFNLSKTGFRKIHLLVPLIKKQTAIAEVLTTADKEIELLEQKLEAFKIQKKGLMQVLLTGEKRLLVNS